MVHASSHDHECALHVGLWEPWKPWIPRGRPNRGSLVQETLMTLKFASRVQSLES